MRGSSLAVTLVAILISCTVTAKYTPKIEMMEESGCRDSEFRLTCSGLNTRIAIREAIFVPDNSSVEQNSSSSGCLVGPIALPLNGSSPTMSEEELMLMAGTNTSLPQGLPDMTPDYNLRKALNHRCSGVNHCSFILRDDHAEARDWGPGTISIRYACVPEQRMSKFCGGKVNVSEGGEGFLMTPGYPKYYVGEKECMWEVRGSPGQAVGVEVLDLALRGIGPLESKCTDVLEVHAGENPEALLSVCGELANLPMVHSKSGLLRVTVRTASKTLFPKRGVLLRYTALSCPDKPPPPRDGYLVHHNESMVMYMCCVGMAFPDTGFRRRALQCRANFTWDLNVPDCVNTTLLQNFTHIVEDARNLLQATMIKESDYILDLVLPSVIIATLLIGNIFILALIFHLRRRSLGLKEFGNEEELGEILPHGGGGNGVVIL